MPRRALVPRMCTWPPTTIVGSKPASVRTMPVSEVVVVLPCVPATATPCFRRMISPSISARRMTGMPRSRAAATSALDSATAEEMTTRSASATCAGSWPIDDLRAELLEARGDRPTGRGRSRRSRGGSPAAGSPRCRSSRRPPRPRSGCAAAAETSPGRLRLEEEPRQVAPPRRGRASDFAFWAIAARRARSFMSSTIVPARLSAVELLLVDHDRAAPRPVERPGVLEPGGRPRRRRTAPGSRAGRPRRARPRSSRPRARATRSAAAICSQSLGRNGSSFQLAGIRV